MPGIYDVLTSEETEKIHLASLRVLDEIGMAIEHPWAAHKLAEAGVKIDRAKGRAFFPPEIVESKVRENPAEFICGARDPQFDLNMRAGQVVPYLRTDAGPISLFDLSTNQGRPLSLKDIEDKCTLSDALTNIDVVSAMTPMDVPSPIFDVAVVKLLLEANRKHFWALVSNSLNLKYELEMLEVVAGSRENLRKRPLASGIVCVIDPLRMPYDEIERLLLYGQYGIPIRIPIASIIGANAPFTLAGTMTQVNAEFLGASTIVQILCPGLPVWYYPLIQMLDIKTGATLGDGPEVLLIYSACAQMARRYQVPANLTNMSLGSVQSHQIMYHLGAYQFFGCLLGAAEQGGAGSVQDALGYSHQALVLCDESMSYAKRYLAGLNINDDTLGVDDIREMASKGEYLSSQLTKKYLRKEPRFKPQVWDWRNMVDWQRDPTTIVDRANEVVNSILAQHEVPPLEDDKQRELDEIYERAERHLL